EGDRQLALTDQGRALAVRVMRKHRLAECLLVEVIGLPWEEVHVEACRWEHVISEQVERRLVELLRYPVRCPHGNVIPGLDELHVPAEALALARDAGRERPESMASAALAHAGPVVIARISEQVQSDAGLMLKLWRGGIQPGREVMLVATDDGVRVTSEDSSGGTTAELPRLVAAHVFVARP
ncbi:MAG: dihydrofolate reductase, partial [Actinobacteria bacterium]|nr:dihydrofolate reductase [Actinomycetota bacterium]